MNGGATPPIRSWVDEEDPLTDTDNDHGMKAKGEREGESRARLLEGIEAGGVTAAMELERNSLEEWGDGYGDGHGEEYGSGRGSGRRRGG